VSEYTSLAALGLVCIAGLGMSIGFVWDMLTRPKIEAEYKRKRHEQIVRLLNTLDKGGE
jgi:hypothetical protein